MPTLDRLWTADDLREMPDDGNRYEVIDGILLVTPAPAWRHQDALALLLRLFADYLDVQRVGHAVLAPADVVFSAKRSVQPDLFIVPLVDGRRPERFEDVGRLLVAVEVLSPSSARADRVLKRAMYRDEGVDEYWVVDLDSRAIERSTPAHTHVEVFSESIAWQPEGAARPLAIDLVAYFRKALDD